jgi:hypothetical protein
MFSATTPLNSASWMIANKKRNDDGILIFCRCSPQPQNVRLKITFGIN